MTVALVSGAGRGIGRAIAVRLAQDGARVIGAGRDMAALEETVAAVAGGEGESLACDLRDAGAVARLGETAGHVDVLVANSGIAGPTAPLWEVDPADWEDTLRVNLTGTFLLCRALLPAMLEHRAGSVVVIGSTSALRPIPARSPYSASKSGLIGLVRSLALDTGPFGVRVNLISPGPTAGDRLDAVVERQAEARGVAAEAIAEDFVAASPLRRVTEPGDIADAVAYLAGDGAKAITGSELVVASGWVMS